MRERRAAWASPFDSIVPALSTAMTSVARVDRSVCMLRVVEAVRGYASAHDGRPPATLAAMGETPIPIDPMTGLAFDYQVTTGPDGKPLVTINAPMVDNSARTQLRYELRFVPLK